MEHLGNYSAARTRDRSVSVAVASPRVSHVAVDSKFLLVDGERFWIKGVTYGSFAANEEGEPFPSLWRVKEDFAQMADAGINTVRLYAPPTDAIADEAARAGLYLIPDICWGPRYCELDDPDRVRFIFDWTRRHARRLAGHPAILINSAGNEIPPLIIRWYGRRRIEAFLRQVTETIKAEAPSVPVTYVNHPPTEYLQLPFLDVVSFNVYLEREGDFRCYLARLQSLAGDRPLLLAELGLDANKNGPEAQSEALEWQLKACYEKGLAGAAIYSWTDEWSIFGEEIEGWAFGITDKHRRAKPAFGVVKRIYQAGHYRSRVSAWPKVSVVVCSYNGGTTITETLDSLVNLNYPNYEVIVVNDGSTDDTASIARKYPFRLISVSNGGLSNARNLGIKAAEGELIAFIDSDAYADPDWLYFLVTAMEDRNASAAGGPNFSPPGDGFKAKCVDHAPGNPTHVLLSDETAEHVPGCNMAFRREALEAVGAFDPTHRTAGDDVDVCWKLLVREETIAFSPCAIVWHHRRPSLAAYLRQQKGYGYAEAHLMRRYPGRFNIFGDLVWAGSIYDSPHSALRENGLPSLIRPRVYQGRFGSAQFQSIYQPFRTWWFQIFTTAEWQLTTWCLLASGILGLWIRPDLGFGLLPFGALMFASTILAAGLAGRNAWRAERSKDYGLAGAFISACLHLVQPLWRAAGFVRGLWATRGKDQPLPGPVRLWGNMSQREAWLDRLQTHLSDCGWRCAPDDEWNDGDIVVEGPGPYRVKLVSTYEDDNERGFHFVRFRVTAGLKPTALLWLAAAGIFPLAIMYAFLWPLALPAAFVLWRFLTARRYMKEAVSQLAVECAEPLGMSRVGPDYER